MPATIVQSNSGDTGTTTPTSVTATLAAAATAGNTLLLLVSCDATAIGPSGWTLDTSAVFNNGHYLWRLTAAGGETSAVITPGSAASTAWVIMEVSGLTSTPLDVAAGNGQGTTVTTWTTPAITPAASASRFIVASWGTSNGASGQSVPASPSGGFTMLAARSTSKITGTNVGIGVATQSVASTSGSYSSTATFTEAAPTGITAAYAVSGTTPVNIAGSPGTARARRPATGTVSTASSVTITGTPSAARARGTEGVLTIATVVTVGGPGTARARATPTGTVSVGVRVAGASGTARARTAPASTLSVGVTVTGSSGTARGRAPAVGTVTVGSAGAVTVTGTPGTARGRAAPAGTVTIGVTIIGSPSTARVRRAPGGAVTTGVVVTTTPGTARARRASPGVTTVGVTVTSASGTARARSGPAQASADADLTVTLGPTVTRWVTGSITTRWAGGQLVTRWHVGRPTRGGGYTVHLLSVPAASTDYVLVPVTVAIAGASVPTDPTTMSVAIAVTPEGTAPVTADWRAATWETAGGVTYARLLVGPGAGGLALAAGRYTVWVRITSSPEVPVRAAGTLLLT